MFKGFPFLYQQTRDCLNLQQTKTLIHAMCRWNDRLAQHIISMIFQAISKHTEVLSNYSQISNTSVTRL